MKEYILRSDNDFLIKIGKDQLILNKYNSYRLKLDDNEDDLLKVYPLFFSPKSLPFCLNLTKAQPSNVKTTDVGDCKILDIAPHAISTYEDILQQEVLDYKNSKIFVSVAKEKIFVFNKDQSVAIKNNNQKFDFEINGDKLIGNSKELILILNLKNFNYKLENYKKLNKNAEKIEILRDLNDFSGHLMVNTLNINDDIKNENIDLYYKDNRPNKTNNSLLIPNIVLDSIKLGDLDLAKSYISNTIMLNGDQLKTFFGNFDNYEVLDGKYYLIKDNKAYKELIFIINNGSIIDIDDKDLK